MAGWNQAWYVEMSRHVCGRAEVGEGDAGFDFFEDDLDAHADPDVLGGAVDEVADHADAFVEVDHDDVPRDPVFQSGMDGLVGDGVAVDGPEA